jgi:hypothetical protein
MPPRWSRSTPLTSRISGRAIPVRVECAACGHEVLIPPSALLHGLRLAPMSLVVDDLESRLRGCCFGFSSVSTDFDTIYGGGLTAG